MITLEESKAIRHEWHKAESEKAEVFDVMFGEFAYLLDTADVAAEMYKLLTDIMGWDGILDHSKIRIAEVIAQAEAV